MYRRSRNSAVINFRALMSRRGLPNERKVVGSLETQEIELVTRNFLARFLIPTFSGTYHPVSESAILLAAFAKRFS